MSEDPEKLLAEQATLLCDRRKELLLEQEVAEGLRWTVANLRKRRLRGLPPAWIKIGSSVRYERQAIEDFIRNGQQPTSATKTSGLQSKVVPPAKEDK